MSGDPGEWIEAPEGMAINEHGLWCEVCGELIAAPWHLDDDDYMPPECCTNCGWPDEFDPEAI